MSPVTPPAGIPADLRERMVDPDVVVYEVVESGTFDGDARIPLFGVGRSAGHGTNVIAWYARQDDATAVAYLLNACRTGEVVR